MQFLNWKEPLYAYEIEKIIKHIHARDWLDIGFSTIYYALNRLYKKGIRHPSKSLAREYAALSSLYQNHIRRDDSQNRSGESAAQRRTSEI